MTVSDPQAALPTDRPAGSPRRSGRALGARHAWVLWGLFALVVVGVKYGGDPPPGDVFNLYRQAALDWRDGAPLFDGTGNAFNYLPTAALPFLPFSYLPFAPSGALWRLVNVLVFGAGAWSLCRAALAEGGRSGDPGPARRAVDPFVPVTLVALLLAWSAARHGQLTLAMTGAMMFAAAAAQRDRPWRAALWGGLALAMKPYGIVAVLLLAAVAPRTRGRLLVVVGALALAPFALQRPDYVLDQYAAVPDMLRAAANREAMPGYRYSNVFAILESVGLGLSDLAAHGVRVAFAFVFLAFAWVARPGRDAERPDHDGPRPPGVLAGSAFLFALTAGYVLLFNPGTEQNTYAMMGPALGLFLAAALAGGRRVEAGMLGLAVVASLLARSLFKAYPDSLLATAKPMACVLLMAVVMLRVRSTDPDGARGRPA